MGRMGILGVNYRKCEKIHGWKVTVDGVMFGGPPPYQCGDINLYATTGYVECYGALLR